jgi:hypothetical protein
MSGNGEGTKWSVERALKERPPILHPLGGCDVDTFLVHLSQNSGFSARSRMQRLIAVLAVIARHPFSCIEKIRYGEAVQRYQLEVDPVFIVGHWRSGTTHLHNLLSHDPQFRFLDFGQTALPHNLLGGTRGIARDLVASVLPKKRGYDNVDLTIDAPQEEEMALGSLNPLGYYAAYYFPQNMLWHFARTVFFEGVTEEELEGFKKAYVTLVKKLSLANDGKQLLFKNPPSTARIRLLKELFPGGRFIYIHRNPYEVYASSLNRYFRLMQAFAWQDFSNIDFEEMVYHKYRRLLQGYLEQRPGIPEADIIETTYEAITERPMEEIRRIYNYLNLPNREEGLAKIEPYAQSLRNYERNKYRMPKATVERIQREWAFSFQEWPSDLPNHIEVAG